LGGAATWRLEPVQVQSFALSAGPERPVATTSVDISPNGWRLLSEEGGAIITILPDSISLEVTAYRGWVMFHRTINALLETAAEVLRPEAETRLALRYINRLEQPAVQAPREWAELIDEHVLGIIHHPIGEAVTAAQQQLQVRMTDSERATVQHGFLRDPVTNRLTYLLDFDVFREGARTLDLADATAAVEALHRAVLQLFQSFITPRLYEFLKSE
jgi:uncharacterized protein (TIGR04255 family)